MPVSLSVLSDDRDWDLVNERRPATPARNPGPSGVEVLRVIGRGCDEEEGSIARLVSLTTLLSRENDELCFRFRFKSLCVLKVLLPGEDWVRVKGLLVLLGGGGTLITDSVSLSISVREDKDAVSSSGRRFRLRLGWFRICFRGSERGTEGVAGLKSDFAAIFRRRGKEGGVAKVRFVGVLFEKALLLLPAYVNLTCALRCEGSPNERAPVSSSERGGELSSC